LKTIVIANQKGGVGKTTTTISLAGLLVEKAQKVLLVDLDPHGSLSNYLSLYHNEQSMGCYELFVNKSITRDLMQSLQHTTNFPGLNLIPASLSLSTLDRKSSQKNGLGLVLNNALATIKGDYDFVLIDCPPVIGVLMINALVAADILLIPVQTEFLALHGLKSMIDTLIMIEKSRAINLEYLIVPTLFDKRTRACQTTLKKLHSVYPDNIWHCTIPLDTKLREASQQGVPPSFYSPSSKGVWSYSLLLKNILQHLVQRERTVKHELNY